LFSSEMMATKKLGQLCGVDIVRVMKPVGVRVRCEFVSVKQPFVEFEIAGDLALGIAKELEMLLALKTRKTAVQPKRQRAPAKKRRKTPNGAKGR
jgi:hypothetical protein